MELHRKNPYSKMKRSPEHKNKSKIALNKSKSKSNSNSNSNSKSPKKRREEVQVEELNKWENRHVPTNRNSDISNPRQSNLSQRPDRPIVKNLILIPDKEPLYHNKAALPAKSPLSLLNQKMKYQKEYDALEGLKKRRELIQKRLNEISERHRQRQLKKQNRYKNHSNINMAMAYNQQTSAQAKRDRESKSEQPFISNPIHPNNINQKSSISEQGSPYKRPLRGNQIQIPIPSPMQYSSPHKSKSNSNTNTNINTSKSVSQSPLKYAGANAIGISGNSSNSSSSASSMSVSPESETSMNPRERMQARKRAKADARARQLKQASKLEFHQNKLQAAQNKYQVSGNAADATMSRAASLSVFDDVSIQDRDIISDQSSGGTMSEPPYLVSTMKEYSRDIMTIKEGDDESANLDDNDDDEQEEEDEIAEEIDELKQTLMEHINQIEEIKNTILMKKKEQLSDSDNDNEDDGNEVDDVETLLNEQEQTMKTMRFQEEMKIQENKNIEQNHIDIDCESDESSEEMPIGRLVDRIEFIKRKCVSGMGLDGFKIAYNMMKQLQYEDKDELVAAIDNKIRQLCNKRNVSKSRVQKYRSLIDQLLFIEANCS